MADVKAIAMHARTMRVMVRRQTPSANDLDFIFGSPVHGTQFVELNKTHAAG
jgi:hypothetical protein